MSKWIPVTERLPDKDENVLCYSKYGTMFIGYRGCNSGQWYDCEMEYRGGITHWMPLPLPPETEKGDEGK